VALKRKYFGSTEQVAENVHGMSSMVEFIKYLHRESRIWCAAEAQPLTSCVILD